MSLVSYGFIDLDLSKPCTVSNFIKNYSSIIEEIIDHPDSEIFLTDFGGGLPLARFLKERYFRNAVLYYVGDKPQINICKFTSLKGGFSTREECQSQIEKDTSRIYKMSDIQTHNENEIY